MASQVAKLSLFWRTCILPEMLGRWYTRKMDLKEELGPDPNGGDCYCRKTCDEPTATCSNPDCPISRFHLACLCLQSVSKTWLCHIAGSYHSLAVARKGSKRMG